MKLNEVVAKQKVLWVDDVRNPPADLQCDIARTYDQAVQALNTSVGNQYDVVYLDHDLGDYTGPEGKERTGYDVLMHIVQMKHDGHPVPHSYHILTANPVGRDKFLGVIKRYLS